MATGDIISATIGAEGFYADITIAGLSTGGTYAFGFGTNNDPLTGTPKVTLTVVSPGYTASATSTTVTRTVYGTFRVRQIYPNNALAQETASGGNVTVRVALDDDIYTGDTVTGAFLSGFYTQASTPNNAASGLAVTNSSALGFLKAVGRFVTVPYQRETGDFTVEFFGGQRSAQNGEPLACAKFLAADQHGNTSSVVVSDTTLSAANASGIRLPVYSGTIPTSGLTDGDVITVNVEAYPWVGNTTAVLRSDLVANGGDGVAAPSEQLGPQPYLLDKSGSQLPPLYCVVDAALGNDTTGVASATLSSAEAARCLTINGAKAKAAAIRANGEAVVIYLVAGTYTYTGSTNAWSQTTPARVWTTIAPHPTLGSQAGSIIGSGNNSVATGKLRFSGVTLSGSSTGTIRGTSGSTLIWLDNCAVNLTVASSVYGGSVLYYTDLAMTAFSGGLVGSGNTHGPIALIRGCAYAGATNYNAHFYCVVANEGNFELSPQATGNLATHAISDNAVAAYNHAAAISGSWLDYGGTQLSIGLLFACNSISTTNNNRITLSADTTAGTNSNFDNVMFWHVSNYGGTSGNGRLNFAYDAYGSGGFTRKSWSIVGNVMTDFNNKTDTFGTPDPGRTNWQHVGYMVGSKGNCITYVSSFPCEFFGLQTKYTVTQSYVDATNGNLRPTSSSPSRNLYSASRRPIKYDLDGNLFATSGTTVTGGAFQYTPDIPAPPSSTGNARSALSALSGLAR